MYTTKIQTKSQIDAKNQSTAIWCIWKW